MMMNSNDKTYWETRYKEGDFPWNLGKVSSPIKQYVDQLTDKDQRILIPGSGFGHEAKYLWQSGFKNVYINDYSKKALQHFKSDVPSFPSEQILVGDFFNITSTYDLVIEQTFFCALPPSMRSRYVEKMHSILKFNGKLIGLFFNFDLTDKGPPFGGSKKQYVELFEDKFSIKTLDTAYNSEESRANKELFFIFDKTP